MMVKANFVCPECGGKEKIEVPENVCVAFKICKHCGKKISAKKDSCCIICSYSDKKCPVHKDGHKII